MELLNNLYTIKTVSENQDGYDYSIALNPEHFIYKAHFPGEPITPGVCLIQMANELLEYSVKEKLSVVYVKNIKFLEVIRPDSTPELECHIRNISREGDSIKAQFVVDSSETVFVKMSITFRKAL